MCDTMPCSEQRDDPEELLLQEEMRTYGDIVRLDLVDTYADLSLKTLKMFSVLPQVLPLSSGAFVPHSFSILKPYKGKNTRFWQLFSKSSCAGSLPSSDP